MARDADARGARICGYRAAGGPRTSVLDSWVPKLFAGALFAGACHQGGGTPNESDSHQTTGGDEGSASADATVAHTTSAGTGTGMGESGVDVPDPPSDNVIDVAIWPRIIDEAAYPLVPASDRVLCRRMALDLWGMIPTPAEYASLCEGRDPATIASAMMQDERFVAREVRMWFRVVGADSPDVAAFHLRDADPIFAALARGELRYEEFAGELLAHPVMTISRPEAEESDPTMTIHHAYQFFMGRMAQGEELAQFGNLLRVWNRGYEFRPSVLGGYYKRVAYLNASICEDPVYGNGWCSADLYGQQTVIDLADIFFENVPPENFEGQLPGVFYFEMVHGGQMPPDFQAQLVKPGLLLATQDEFWDEAGERALTRILGWWRTTANEPESTLPEVRLALGTWWRDHPTHGIRELYAEILTSLLYTTSAVTLDDDERSLWAVGPTRLMDGEQFLDSVEVAFDRELGFCDIHTKDAIGTGNYDDFLRVPQPEDFYGFGRDVYFDWGSKAGGCTGGAAAPRQPGVRGLFAHSDVADMLCAPPSRLVNDEFDLSDTSAANRTLATEQLYERLLTRLPDAEEAEVLAEAGETCLADPTCAEQGLAGFVREVCGAVVRSGEFAFY